MIKKVFSSFLTLVVFTIILGLFYPTIVYFFGQVFFSQNADGSLVYNNKILVGSTLIGQNFSQERYFHPRPSYAGEKGYDATDSNASNLSSTSLLLKQTSEERAKAYRTINNLAEDAPIPVDAITASASGLDPHISLANAFLQMPRIAKARNISEGSIKKLIEKHTENPFFGLLGQKRVNVLMLNLSLDSNSYSP